MKLGRNVLVPVAIVGVGVLGVLVMVATRPAVEARPPQVIAPLVRVVEAQPQEVRFSVRAQGTVVPRTEGDLVPQVSGEVVWVSPDLVSGGFFEKDAPLVRIDTADYRADLETARAVLARTQSEFARSKTELERQRRLASSNVASQARIDDAENAYRVTEAAVREARARLGRAERDLARTELRAPYEGRVRSKDVDVGQFVNRGSPIATLYATDYAEVRLPLPDRELRYVSLPLGRGGAMGEESDALAAADGPEVRLTAEFAGEQRAWTGRVVRTEGEIDPRSRMLNVVARVEDPYGRHADGTYAPLAVGLFVEAEILGRSVPNAFVLPRTALRQSDEGAQVYVVDDEGRLHFRGVEVIRTEREQVVIGAGLGPGDRVAVSPLAAAVDGMSVRIADAPQTQTGTASGPAPSAGGLARSEP